MQSPRVPLYAVIFVLIWLLLITSLFYDPLTPYLTDTSNSMSPFSLENAETCLLFQGQCMTPTTYALGARLFWGMVIPVAVICLLLFGTCFWREVCPLAWIVQIPRILGWRSKKGNLISRHSWLTKYSSYFTFFLFFLGLNLRLLLINSDRLQLGIVLLLISLAALGSGFWFGGRTWCQYFCPMIAVETIYLCTEGALGNPLEPKPSKLPSKLCQVVDSRGQPKNACVGCDRLCADLHFDNLYWQEILHPGRKWLYYGYLGLVIGFFLYFPLCSGNNQYWGSGAVWLEKNQMDMVMQPGFYLFDQVIPIPKIIAVPLTLSLSVLLGYSIGIGLEKTYKRILRRKGFSEFVLQHHCFSVCTFISFNLFYFMGIRPSLGWLPVDLVKVISWFLSVMALIWLYRALRRSVPKRFQKIRQKNYTDQNRKKQQLTVIK